MLKINLNKRIAYPLTPGGIPQQQSQSHATLPLLQPPKLKPANNEESASNENDKTNAAESFDSCKERVIDCFESSANDLNPGVKSSVLTKLTSLSDDWNQLDPDIKKLLVELSQCKLH